MSRINGNNLWTGLIILQLQSLSDLRRDSGSLWIHRKPIKEDQEMFGTMKGNNTSDNNTSDSCKSTINGSRNVNVSRDSDLHRIKLNGFGNEPALELTGDSIRDSLPKQSIQSPTKYHVNVKSNPPHRRKLNTIKM